MKRWCLWLWIPGLIAHYRGLRALKRGDYVTLEDFSVDDPYCND